MTNIIKFEEQKQEIDYFKSLVAIAVKSSTYQGMSPEVMLNIMLTAKDLGISPMKALNGGFYIVNGKISMSTSLMTDRIRSQGHSIKITEWSKDKCVMIGKRRDNDDSVKVEFTMEDAQLAGLTASSTWKKYPKAMLYNRAMSMLARVLFPDIVGNAYSEDERFDIMNVPPEKRPETDPEREVIAIGTVSISTEEKKEVDYKRGLKTLGESLLEVGIDPSSLEEFVSFCSSKKGRDKSEVVDSAILSPDMTRRFIESYCKWLQELQEETTA